MNPTLGIKKVSLFGNTLSILFYLFLVESDTAYLRPYNATAPIRIPYEYKFSYYRPSSNQKKLSLADELDWIEEISDDLINKLQFMKENKLLHINGNLRTRVEDLERHTHYLQTSIYHIRQNMTKKIDSNINEKTYNLSESLKHLDEEIDYLQFEITQTRGLLQSEIVNDVKSHRFNMAQDKLNGLDDDKMYYSVFQEILNNRDSNFGLLIDFANYISPITFKSKIYDFLFKQMVTGGGINNIRKMLKLRQSIKREILDITGPVIPETVHYNMLKNSMEEAAVEPVYSAFLYNNSWATVKQLLTEISEDCPNCTNRIFNMVIKAIWNKITIDDLLCRAHQNLNFTDNIEVHLAVMNTLKHTGGLHNNSVITFAQFMKLIMMDPKYKNESLQRKTQYEEAKNEVPESVRNLVFASAICIKNIRHNEYLYAAAAPNYVYNDHRRHVFTWIPGNRDEPPQFKWHVRFHYSHGIVLRNDKYNEYLYASGISYDDTRRYVFTWRPGTTVTNGIWRVEIDGNYIHMFNTERGGYLFADHDAIKDESRRYVFTNRRAEKTTDSKWEIVDCSNFN